MLKAESILNIFFKFTINYKIEYVKYFIITTPFLLDTTLYDQVNLL